MPINVNSFSYGAPSQAAINAKMATLQVLAVDRGLFTLTLHHTMVNWATIYLDTPANPANAQANGTVSYQDSNGVSQNYPVTWFVKVSNWVLHTSCDVLLLDVR